jgi:hypothetical protein
MAYIEILDLEVLIDPAYARALSSYDQELMFDIFSAAQTKVAADFGKDMATEFSQTFSNRDSRIVEMVVKLSLYKLARRMYPNALPSFFVSLYQEYLVSLRTITVTEVLDDNGNVESITVGGSGSIANPEATGTVRLSDSRGGLRPTDNYW